VSAGNAEEEDGGEQRRDRDNEDYCHPFMARTAWPLPILRT
jgi:hypothetical protein